MHPNVPPLRPTRQDDESRFRVPPSLAGPKLVFVICHYCGYDPELVPADGACPKCGGHSWERYALSARLVPKSYHR